MVPEHPTHTPGKGLEGNGIYWTYDGEVIPDELLRSLDSAEEELSDEAELAFVRYWMEHPAGQSNRIDRWYDLCCERYELEQQHRLCKDARSLSRRLEATALEGRLKAIGETLAWIEEGMAAVLESQSIPGEPEAVETVKVADLFGSVVDTHLDESRFRNPLHRRSRR